jgi:hypothetical protein
VGEKMILEGNAFVERLLPAAIVRKLTAEEMSVYRAPFPTPESRLPTRRFPNEVPIAGQLGCRLREDQSTSQEAANVKRARVPVFRH